MKKIYRVTLLRPSGNDTALVQSIPTDPGEKKRISDRVMQLFRTVEQVGFYETSDIPHLEMAGGEFCGNALRSLAYIVLKRKSGEIRCRISGVKDLLSAGVKKDNSVFAQIPIKQSFRSVQQLDNNLWQVDIEGIIHLIKPVRKSLSVSRAKYAAKKLLGESDIKIEKPAAGVMFVTPETHDGIVNLQPVVWVRDIQTFFYETACASGTAAVGLWRSAITDKRVTTIKVKQPSQQCIQAIVKKDSTRFLNAYVQGSVEMMVEKGEISV